MFFSYDVEALLRAFPRIAHPTFSQRRHFKMRSTFLSGAA